MIPQIVTGLFVLFSLKLFKNYVNHSTHSQAVGQAHLLGEILTTLLLQPQGDSVPLSIGTASKNDLLRYAAGISSSFTFSQPPYLSLYIIPSPDEISPFCVLSACQQLNFARFKISNDCFTQSHNLVLFFPEKIFFPLLKSLDNILFLLFALNLVDPENLYTLIFQQ